MLNELLIDVNEVKEKAIEFIRNTLDRAGFEKIVVGLSGGIDSALSCFLAVEAVGKENVVGICMPYVTSSEASLQDAQKVIDQLSIQSKVIEITPYAKPFIETIPSNEHVRRGNVMARTRMIILYDQSVELNALVIGTGNKTEILLGYSTQYGDSACAFNPLGDLYKAQVVQLAKFMGVPQSILEKAPSADLWEGQTDEAELGFTYAEIDEFYYYLINKRYSHSQLIEKGYKQEFIDKVIARIKKNEFKRSLPPIFELSDKSANNLEFLRGWGK
jgi:NAD+ synthase